MSTTLQSYARFVCVLDSEELKAGSVETPFSFAVDGETFHKVASIANAANTTMYNDELSTFNFMYLVSDYDVRIVLTDSGANTFSLQLKGTGISGDYGLPLQLGLDETLNTATTLTTVVAFNTSGSTAKVMAFVVK